MDTLAPQQAGRVATRPSEIEEIPGPGGAYIHWLRTEFARGRWAADLSRPSLLYLVYEGAQSLPLDGEIPLQVGQDFAACWQTTLCRQQRARPAQKLSWLLFFTHGLTRRVRPIAGKATLPGAGYSVREATGSGQVCGPVAHFAPMLGRPVPSGGNLHPVEIYLALNQTWDLPSGLYHYDSAHHALDLLRSGDALSPIIACLPENTPPGSAALLLSICIQKNSQKYTSLSYLLQTLDSGIVLEQLSFIATRLGLEPVVHLCFLDRPLHTLMGLTPEENVVYAVVLLGQPALGGLTATPLTPMRARPVHPFVPRPPEPLLQRLFTASLLERLPQAPDPARVPSDQRSQSKDEIALPPMPIPAGQRDLAQVLLRRHTSAQAIDPGAITCEQLAAILHWPGRQRRPLWQLFACQIYCVALRVRDLPPDVYAYSPERHTLRALATPDILPLLIRLSAGSNVQPYLSPALLFFCGNYQQAHAAYGERGLRLLGIEIGRMVQDVALCAAHSDLGVHIHVSTALESIRTRLLQDAAPASLPFATMMVGQPRQAEENLCEALWY